MLSDPSGCRCTTSSPWTALLPVLPVLPSVRALDLVAIASAWETEPHCDADDLPTFGDMPVASSV